jgi:transposase
MSKGTHYTSEFKRESVKIAVSSNKSIALVAKELGVNPKTLYSWVSQSMKIKKSVTSKISTTNSKHRYQELERENDKLKKDLKRAQMERDILKKAAAYFASQEL